MRVDDYCFDLPDDLIASYPCEHRTGSALMKINLQTKAISHHQFPDLTSSLRAGDLLLLNDTKVMLARLSAKKPSGGRVSILITSVDPLTQKAYAMIKSNAKLAIPSTLIVAEDIVLCCEGRLGQQFVLSLQDDQLDWFELMALHGQIPLPPYMGREAEKMDIDRYQTVYASKLGAVAAPTAGLHFDDKMLASIKNMGVDIAYVTLHVGPGTFQPLRVDNIADHRMHTEQIDVSQEVCEKWQATRARLGRVIAVGTTSLRAMEACFNETALRQAYRGETDLFISPGYACKAIDGLLTNFHLPKSSLLMLVSALMGRDLMLKAYHEAIAKRYRFYSYGDAMLLL